MRNLYLFISLLFLFSCSIENSNLKIASYNVENLFDDKKNGNEYYEYNPDYGRWGSEEFNNKLGAVARVIRDCDADIIALQEVENSYCVKMLLDFYLQGCGYNFSFCPDQNNSSINCAILSRIPIKDIHCHQVYTNKVFLRYILELEFSKRGKTFTIFVNHWKSRRGGISFTAPYREITASLLFEKILECKNENKDTLIVALGDFNAEPKEVLSYLSNYNKNNNENLKLQNFWDLSNEKGSYFYKKHWEKIDGIYFLSKEKLNIESFVVKNSYQLYNGAPRKFYKKSGDGFSDHLPLKMVVNF